MAAPDTRSQTLHVPSLLVDAPRVLSARATQGARIRRAHRPEIPRGRERSTGGNTLRANPLRRVKVKFTVKTCNRLGHPYTAFLTEILTLALKSGYALTHPLIWRS